MSSFYVVGVGTGNPQLLTVQAVEILRKARAIYHAGPGERQGRAWEIIRELVWPDQEIRRLLSEPMSTVARAADWRQPYRPGVEQIAADCRRGLEVAFVTEGDPSLYSTALPVCQLLQEIAPDLAITIVPGISSMSAAAARAHWPLAHKGETLRIIPAAHHAAELASLMEADSSLCLLKAGPALPQIIDVLNSQPDSWDALYVENLGSENEWTTRELNQALGRDAYFSLVLLRRRALVGNALPGAVSGKVCIVGLGPGDPDLLTPQALRALRSATDIVGYAGYLELIRPLECRGACHALALGAETERARLALDLARQGRQVALVSSGDAGVYGMASLLLETAGDARAVDVEVIPGVTAATAAAALLGAPLGHDFVCISLSDLLTPWALIERRLQAAGQGDFVVVLYNPASQQRRWQLPRARDILAAYRKDNTPVGLVNRAYRPGVSVDITTLDTLNVDNVTMETTIIVGNSRTQKINGRLVTPRGYLDRAENSLSGGREPPEPCTLRGLTPPAQESRQPLAGGDAGGRILAESFRVIERELGPLPLPAWAFAVVRRMIHASADFDFAHTLRYSEDFEAALRSAFRARVPLVTDTEMVLHGVRTAVARIPGLPLTCLLNDAETTALAANEGLTRSAAAMRVTARRHARPVLLIGNAPTAVEEALRLVAEENWRPAAVIGIPVGFVGVEEAKRHLQEQTRVPYLTCVGRKGGSAVTAAAVNALVEIAAPSGP
jgi:cobalt-factor III methyltransferase